MHVDDIKNDWKEAEYGPQVKEFDESFGSRRNDVFSDHEYFGCIERECNADASIGNQKND